MHRIIANVSVLAIDDDTLRESYTWISTKNRVREVISQILASTPVSETICAMRTEEMAMKVMSGNSPDFNLLSSLNRELALVVVWAVL